MPLPLVAKFASTLARARAAKRASSAITSLPSSGDSSIQGKIKKIQFALDVVKGVSLFVSMFTGGLDGFSIGTFLLVGNGELLADKFTSVYKIPQWKKMVIIWCNCIAIVLGLVLFGMVFLIYWCYENNAECITTLGLALAGEIGEVAWSIFVGK
ncbi:MAG: hypothetical protein AAB657_00990 [Patescibacteria group bacterium]